MDPMYNTFRPSGFHTINSYLFTDFPVQLIDFLKKAFNAQEMSRTINQKDGTVANCILQIGDSAFMISQSTKAYPAMPGAFYLFVADTDMVYQKALAAGATSELAPMDMDYDDRQGGVRDVAGNIWWISTRLVEEDYKD